jgi:hypothetical protein
MTMRRGIDDRNILEKFVEEFTKIIEKYTDYIIVSGFVAIASGRTRATEDIDMIVRKIDFNKYSKLHAELIERGFHCMNSSKVKDVYEYLSTGNSIRYVRKPSFMPPEMEIKFAKDEIDEMQLKTKMKLPFTNLDVWFSSIDMNIAFKEELLRSDKDMEDARHLRIVYSKNISEKNINKIKDSIRKMRLGK